MNKVKKINLDDLLYTNPNKIKPIKEEYDKEDDSYKNDPHIKKAREDLKKFINNIIDEKITSEEDLSDDYLKKVKDHKDDLERRKFTPGKNPKKVLDYIQRIEFAVSGDHFQKMPSLEGELNIESEKLDIATGGEDITDPAPSEEPTTGKGLKIMTPSQLITKLPILLAQKKTGNNSNKLKN